MRPEMLEVFDRHSSSFLEDANSEDIQTLRLKTEGLFSKCLVSKNRYPPPSPSFILRLPLWLFSQSFAQVRTMKSYYLEKEEETRKRKADEVKAVETLKRSKGIPKVVRDAMSAENFKIPLSDGNEEQKEILASSWMLRPTEGLGMCMAVYSRSLPSCVNMKRYSSVGTFYFKIYGADGMS